jgi:hypothetical protein
MGKKRAKLTIAAEIATIATACAVASGWLYRHFDVPGAWPLWVGKVNWVYVLFGISFIANILFSIGSRIQAKSVPIKVAHGFHAGKIDGGEAALFWHYSACSHKPARQLEEIWQHWYEAGEVLSRPLDRNLPMKSQFGGPSRELDIFTIIYGEHLYWLEWEIPEFSTTLPPLGSGEEYLTLLNDLKTHARLLDEAAKQICESMPIQKEQAK